MGLYCRNQAAPWIEFSHHRDLDRMAGLYDILEYAVDRIFIEYSQIAVGQEIHLEGLEFQTALIRNIGYKNRPKIRESCFWTDRSEFRMFYFYLIIGELIGKNIDSRESGS